MGQLYPRYVEPYEITICRSKWLNIIIFIWLNLLYKFKDHTSILSRILWDFSNPTFYCDKWENESLETSKDLSKVTNAK